MNISIEDYEKRLAMEIGNRDLIIIKKDLEIELLKQELDRERSINNANTKSTD